MRLPEFRKGFRRIFLLALWIPSFYLCSTALAGEVLKIGGTGAALGSMQLLAKAFEKSHPGTNVVVILSSLGSTGSIQALSKGAIDIGLSARPLKDEERRLGLSAIEYARTPIIFATRKEVGITGLSTDEIIKIYRGEKETWPGGERIRLVLRPTTETDTLVIKKISPDMSNAVETALSRQGMAMALTDQDCVEMIGKNPGGFGVTTLTQILSEKRPLKILSLNGVIPSVKNLANGSYLIYKSLYLVTKVELSGLASKYMAFVRSPDSKKILEESGNVAVFGKPGK